MGLDGNELRVFNIYDIAKGKYLNYYDMVDFCNNYHLTYVPLYSICMFEFIMEELLEMAKGKYENGHNREGIVIRTIVETYSEALGGRLSFKILNATFLLEDED